MAREQSEDEVRIRQIWATMPGITGTAIFGSREIVLHDVVDYLEVVRDRLTDLYKRLGQFEEQNKVYKNTFRGLQDFMTLVQSGGMHTPDGL